MTPQMKGRELMMVDIGTVMPEYSLPWEGTWVRNNFASILGDVNCQQESSFKDQPVREGAKVGV